LDDQNNLATQYRKCSEGHMIPGRGANMSSHLSFGRKHSSRVAIGMAFLGVVGYLSLAEGAGPKSKSRKIDACFSPNGGCEDRIVEEIGKAENQVLVQMYLFTSKPIADALVAAKKRGAKVQVILDKSQEKGTYGKWPVLRRDGVEILFDREHETANNKLIIIDNHLVITGSYNFTKAAEEKNAENIVIIDDESLCSKYLENYEKHHEHAKKPGK
jgi:phosphatidylserine/phosphatidylglycerophosphate/cardiolipin synthase-like enzyme